MADHSASFSVSNVPVLPQHLPRSTIPSEQAGHRHAGHLSRQAGCLAFCIEFRPLLGESRTPPDSVALLLNISVPSAISIFYYSVEPAHLRPTADLTFLSLFRRQFQFSFDWDNAYSLRRLARPLIPIPDSSYRSAYSDGPLVVHSYNLHSP